MLGLIKLGFGFTNSGGTWGKCCLCFGCGGVGGLGPGFGRVVCCEPGLFMLIAGPGICILC